MTWRQQQQQQRRQQQQQCRGQQPEVAAGSSRSSSSRRPWVCWVSRLLALTAAGLGWQRYHVVWPLLCVGSSHCSTFSASAALGLCSGRRVV